MGQRTPLYDLHLALGAKMVDFGGWDMPLHYGSQVEEHHQVRRDCGVFDVSHMTVIDISGPQAKEWLQHLLANDVDRLDGCGRALYSAMHNEQGGVVDDMIVYRTQAGYRLVVNAATRDQDMAWMQAQLGTYPVQLHERSELAMLAIQGPHARQKIADAEKEIAGLKAPEWYVFDRSVNPYRGCEHGCIYCFARPSHAYLGLSPGLDFETRITAKPNAPDLLAAEIGSRGYAVAPIAFGTNTDPYQPVEARLGIMRACLRVLHDWNHPVALVTRGATVLRDLDLLGAMAARGQVAVGVSITTLDADLARQMAPRAPTPATRLRMIAGLAGAGVPVRACNSRAVSSRRIDRIDSFSGRFSIGRAAGS